MGRLDEAVEIANPQQPHCATVLLLDISGSMKDNIGELQEGLQRFKDEVGKDEIASKRVDLAVVTFGLGVAVAHDFSSIDAFEPPQLAADGATPMGEALMQAMDLLDSRKQQYKDKGIDYYRPWIFMITDGQPTDMKPGDARWNQVVTRLHEGEAGKKWTFFAVAVDDADLTVLGQVAPPTRKPILLKEGRWAELFQWLSKSQTRVSAGKVGDQTALPAPTGWGEVAT